jgi:hypothetical protein
MVLQRQYLTLSKIVVHMAMKSVMTVIQLIVMVVQVVPSMSDMNVQHGVWNAIQSVETEL